MTLDASRMFVLDTHCDTPSQILRLRDLSLDNHHAHVDFPKLRQGGVDGVFFALYVLAALKTDDAMAYAEKMLAGVKKAVADNADRVAFARSYNEASANKAKSITSIFLGLENGSPIGHSLDRLHYFYDNGVRYVTLCHSADNQICDSCASVVGKWGGLSPFGRDMIREMNEIGMLVDLSHASDETFYDVLETSSRPVVATHSCCRALCDHPRNMTDDMIRALAQAGGVIQINFYPMFLDSGFRKVLHETDIVERGERVENEFIADPGNPAKRAAWNAVQDELNALKRPSYRRIADHIDHVVDLVGIEHVGIGSDFDGIEVTPSGMDDISMMPVLFDELRTRGYSDSDITAIAGLNFFRVLG